MESKWTPAEVWIFGGSRSRSQCFKFEHEPESTFRSVQEPIKYFKGPIKISVMIVMMLVVFKLNGIN